jgi:alanine dehydrogenase
MSEVGAHVDPEQPAGAGGRGVLLGGVSVSRPPVIILAAALPVPVRRASRSAWSGCTVRHALPRLRQLDIFGARLRTTYATTQTTEEAVQSADSSSAQC